MTRYKLILAALIFPLLFACSGTAPVTGSAAAISEDAPTRVMLLATLHNFHKTNPHYTYDDVYEIIRRYSPDAIGVEIRPEDIGQDTTYLKQMYPLEMRQITLLFPPEKVYGVDWYGEEAAGSLLPPDAFKGGNQQLTQIKQLERDLNADTTLASRLQLIAVLLRKMTELAATNTPAQFNNSGQYDLTAELFYKQMEVMLQGTPYQTYAQFNRKRDEHIGRNIISLIKQHPGKKLIFVLGANHRFAAEQTIREQLGGQVQLVEVPAL